MENETISVPSRRRFLNWLLGGALFSVTGSFLYAVARFLSPPKARAGSGSQEVPVVLKKDLPPGRSMKFRYGTYPAILINLNGELFAYGAICTHLACIAHYKDVKGCAMDMPDEEIHCVCHAGHYDLRTGNVLSGPPPSPLPRLKIAERGEQIVALGWENPDYVARLTTYKI